MQMPPSITRNISIFCKASSIRKKRCHDMEGKNIDNKIYEDIYDEQGEWIDFSQIEMEAENEEALREKFLKAKIWDGKSFWEVEKELARLD